MKKMAQLDQLQSAYERLVEALQEGLDNPLAIDGTIQRFEFCFELAWKTIKTCLEEEGIIANSPKAALQEAYRLQWITDEAKWLGLLHARNLTVHVYDEKIATDIYATIRQSHTIMADLLHILRPDSRP